MKLVVFRLENKTHPKRIDESREEDQLFGNGIKTQLVNTLEQTGQFSIIDNPGPRKVLWSRAVSRSGMISALAKQRFGSLGEAEFLVGGAITRYDLSEESKTAGIDADLFFRESQAIAIDIPVTRAREFFTALPTTAQDQAEIDRVAIELWLFDAKTGQRFARTWLEGSSNDSVTAIGGLFGPYLAGLSEPLPHTPMQRALRAITIKAVNWIAQQGLAFRAQPPSAPVPRVKPRPKPRPKPARQSAPVRQEKKIDFGFEAEESSPSPPVPSSQEQWGDSP